jgi:sulfate adenylyltransferase subunit 2
MNDDFLGLDRPRVWDTEAAFDHLRAHHGVQTKRTAERRLHDLALLPPMLTAEHVRDELGREPNAVVYGWALARARTRRRLVLFAQLHTQSDGRCTLHANDARGSRYWVPLPRDEVLSPQVVEGAIGRLQAHVGKDIVLFPHGALVGYLRGGVPIPEVELMLNAYLPVLDLPPPRAFRTQATPHLKRLEAESIHIIREAVAEARHPAMLYSIGKDSAVMLHLARKAFFPAPPPFPLLHVDTRWKFQEMYQFRDRVAEESGMELHVHINPDAIARDINPFDHGSALHTDITKTEGLKQALDRHGYDLVFGGARRDEEKSRAKERIFSFRTRNHRWDPKNQRPELWDLYNTRLGAGESIRVFPLSNWTELDIWQYIWQEGIPVVPLYFAKKRPVVQRGDMLLMVDDSRFRLLPDEQIVEKVVRFRTLGCYPLTGAVESTASSVPEIILELINARSSERQGRAIDSDAAASMEKKKQEGYF